MASCQCQGQACPAGFPMCSDGGATYVSAPLPPLGAWGAKSSRWVPRTFLVPFDGAAAAPPNGTKAILGTHLEEKSPQAPTSGKRTWPRRRQAAGGPPGLPRCCHRLRSPHLTPSSPEPAYFGPLRPLGVQTSPASLTKKWPTQLRVPI